MGAAEVQGMEHIAVASAVKVPGGTDEAAEDATRIARQLAALPSTDDGRVAGGERSLFVFLNNKLISCDTIVPLVAEIWAYNPRLRIVFYIVDWKSYEVIRTNRVLWDIIHRLGSLKLLGRSKEQRGKGLGHVILHKAWGFVQIMRLAWLGVKGHANFLHFRALNVWPLRVLHLLAPKQVYFCQSTPVNYSSNERQVDGFKAQKKAAGESISAGGGLVAFAPDWHALEADAARSARKFVLGSFWYGRVWPRYVYEVADNYLNDVLTGARLAEDQEFVVYTLGYLGKVEFVPNEDTFKEKLKETLSVLYQEMPETPVLIKPHFNTDLIYLGESIAKFQDHRFIICHLHPAVLATRAKFFIGNYYSTTMAVAHSFGVPVIEFSRYNDRARHITKGLGMRPDIVDHYIDDDMAALRSTIRGMLRETRIQRKVPCFEDPSGIVEALAGVDR